ncbi:TIR domain-containing protein [Nocardioides aurantiacus]|uniref:TIR domain-containing protein n=1 Tax=Nocardioides aurantiacus TaxID=86796 RepID=A0A3N2CU79_9ACTN|nr:TIR domain-containing protein [Nocardioides aurantiacus]
MSEVATSIGPMSQCTAPVLGHIRGGGADCPVHGRGGGYGYAPPRSYPSYPAPTAPVRRSGSLSSSSGGGGRRTARPAWQPSTSTVSYTPQQVRDLEPVRAAAVVRTQEHDVFLCHAWPDRQDDAKDAYDLLVGEGVSVWFSEVSLRPGTDMRVAIERGLVSSRMGIVLVTPAMLDKLRTDRSVANAELSALLRRNLLVPVMHGVTFEELDQVSPTLASRGGFNTAEESMGDIVVKVAELVGTLADEEADGLSMKSADT